MIEIANKTIGASFTYTDGNYRITGDFKKDADGNLKEAGMNISAMADNTYAGYANAYNDGGVLKYNIQNVTSTDIVGVTTSVAACTKEIAAEDMNN